MMTINEHQALEHVRARLSERFPQLPGEIVSVTVQQVHGRFDGRVRDYVPILVEREAKARLEVIAAQARGIDARA